MNFVLITATKGWSRERDTWGGCWAFEDGKQQAGLGNGKEHNETGGVVVVVYTRIEACIRSLEGRLASWTKVCYRMDRMIE